MENFCRDRFQTCPSGYIAKDVIIGIIQSALLREQSPCHSVASPFRKGDWVESQFKTIVCYNTAHLVKGGIRYKGKRSQFHQLWENSLEFTNPKLVSCVGCGQVGNLSLLLHTPNHGIAKLRRGEQLRPDDQLVQIKCQRTLADGSFNTLPNEDCCFIPSQMTQHHLAREDH